MEEAEGLTHVVLKVIYIAIYNDYIARCIKVFEDGKADSFRYIYRTDPKPLDDYAKQLGFSIGDLEPIAKKLKHIRNKTHFHIDRAGARNPKSIWKSANLNGDELSGAVNDTWSMLNHLQVTLGRSARSCPELDTALITSMTRLVEQGRLPMDS